MTLYDPAVLQRPPDNAFEWTINTRDTSLSIEENLTEKLPAMGMAGDRELATEWLKSLVENQMYIGYVSFREVVEYEDVGKMLADYDVRLSWVGVVTSDESHQEVCEEVTLFVAVA